MGTIKVTDQRTGRYLVFDGEFIEKLPARDGSTHRRHISELVSVAVDHKPPKERRLRRGTTEEHWELLVHCGAFFSLQVGTEEKANLDALVDALNRHLGGAPAT